MAIAEEIVIAKVSKTLATIVNAEAEYPKVEIDMHQSLTIPIVATAGIAGIGEMTRQTTVVRIGGRLWKR